MSTQDKSEWINDFFTDAKSVLCVPLTERSSDGTITQLDFTKEQHKASEAAFQAERTAADAKLVSAAMSTQRGVKRAPECDLSDELCARQVAANLYSLEDLLPPCCNDANAFMYSRCCRGLTPGATGQDGGTGGGVEWALPRF